MKNLLKTILVTLLVVSSITIKAQQFGITAGLNLSNMNIENNEELYSSSYLNIAGIHLGINVEIPFNDKFSFEPGIIYSQKGAKKSETTTFDYQYYYTYSGNAKLHYIDIPMPLKANFEVSNDTKIFLKFGPYLGYGLSGVVNEYYEENYYGETYSESTTEDVNWGNDPETDDLKRIDMGLLMGTGIQYQQFVLGINYNLGLINISAYQYNGNKIDNRVLQFSLGYKFGK